MEKGYLKNFAKAYLKMNFTLKSGMNPTGDIDADDHAYYLSLGLDSLIGAGIGYLIAGSPGAALGAASGFGYAGLKPGIVDTIYVELCFRELKKIRKEFKERAKRREMEKPKEIYSEEELRLHWYY